MSIQRITIPRLSLRPIQLSRRTFISSPLRNTTAGYGDPQSEKINNETPTPTPGRPSSSADPQPDGQGKNAGERSGTTDPEVQHNNNKGGDGGGGDNTKSDAQQVRETKKIGEEPKKGNGEAPIGG